MAASAKIDTSDKSPTPSSIRVRSGRIAILYFVAACLWSAVSNVVGNLAPPRSPQLETIAELGNEFGFAVATGILLYFLLEWFRRRLLTAWDSLDQMSQLTESERRRIERIAKIGHWIWRPRAGGDDWQWGTLEYSTSAAAILGLTPSELRIGTREYLDRFVHKDDRLRAEKYYSDPRQGEPGFDFIEFRIVRADGEVRTIHEATEAVVGPSGTFWQGTVQDVTEIKRTEESLRQAQKMEAIGQLTGGIAHDFNNLLMVAGGNLELLQEGLESSPPRLRNFARMAHDAVLRGGNLTQRLLAFARRQNLRPEVIDLNGLVATLVPLLHRTLGEQIAVETALATDVWATLCDASQLENALLNLAVNARDAMPNGGRLTIKTGNVSLDQAWALEIADLQPGDYVMVAVSDTGEGMSPDVRDRAFEPFFTTKEVGRGTGLGLSMVYGFVKQSGGQIKVYSEVGHGTTVKLFLPKAQVSESPDQNHKSEGAVLRGTESVLLVEDDEMVRTTAATILRDLGYHVMEASDGRSALALIESKPPFDLVLTDLVMPGGMTGWDLAQAIWTKQPGSKILFSTGYTDNPIFQSAGGDQRIHLLSKPYGKRALAAKLREVIGHP